VDKTIDNRQRERMHLLEKQIQRMQKHIQTLEPLSNRYSWIRVLLFFGGLGISLIVLIAGYWWLALPLAIIFLLAFAIIAQLQGRIDRSIGQHSLWRHIKSAHVARIKLNWNDIPFDPADPPPAGHPFAYDLDITGKHSIHRLLNTAISREGSQKLCDWLLQTSPDLTTIHSRQALVRELTPMTRFRDKLILKSLQTTGRIAEDLEGQRLLNWLHKSHSSRWLLPLLWLSLAINLLVVVSIALAATGIGPNIWGVMIVVSLLFFLATGGLRGDIFEDAGYVNYGFSTLNSIFSYLETYPYQQKQHLKTLCEPFFRDRVYGPSQLLTKLARLASAATLRKNPYLWLPLNIFLPWDAYCAYRLSKYKLILSERLPEWLDTWFELEALCSLACFAYLNPAYTLPEVKPGTPEDDAICFSGHQLGHPLIPAEKKVTNDFSITERGSAVILTGSNMADKSTIFRTLGLNLCLA
jgi:ABC-type multidrug transport system fused ATPase/permease subunit